MIIEFEQVMQIAILLAVVLAYWWANQSFPPKQTGQLIEQLADASTKTQTKLDDMLVEVARLLNDLRLEQSKPSFTLSPFIESVEAEEVESA
jgi:hypothetical protein